MEAFLENGRVACEFSSVSVAREFSSVMLQSWIALNCVTVLLYHLEYSKKGWWEEGGTEGEGRRDDGGSS